MGNLNFFVLNFFSWINVLQTGVNILVRKRYLFLPFPKIILFSSRNTPFFDPFVPYFSFFFPLSSFMSSIYPVFLFPFSYFPPKWHQLIFSPRGGGIFQYIDPSLQMRDIKPFSTLDRTLVQKPYLLFPVFPPKITITPSRDKPILLLTHYFCLHFLTFYDSTTKLPQISVYLSPFILFLSHGPIFLFIPPPLPQMTSNDWG